MIQLIEIDLGVANASLDIIDVQNADDLHYRFDLTDGAGSVSAVVELKYTIDGRASNAISEAVAVTLELDGTRNTIDVEDRPYVVPVVTTAQAGYKGTLQVYTRPRSARA
jgi:hypothetical protein